MTERFEKHITAHKSGVTAISLLAENISLSKQQLKSAMTNGAVWLESQYGINRIRRAKKELKPGDSLHLYYDSIIQTHTTLPARLIADEGDYSIWDKPCGMYSQGSKWGDHCTIYRWAEQHLQPSRPAYLVHRLDRAASGLIIIAHNRKTANAFAQMFKQHAITKQYRATVEGNPGKLELPFRISATVNGKSAESIILQADYDRHKQTTTLLIEIASGRKHQIRRHLSSIGHPIVGDRLYGAKDTSSDLQLSSIYLSFICPVKKLLREYTITYSRKEAKAAKKKHDAISCE
jgi:tRNA pseudouridine32 synthase/23S rRNA pseudouridine746 synthase